MSRPRYYQPLQRREELLPPDYVPEEEGIFPEGYDPAALSPRATEEPLVPAPFPSPAVEDLPPETASNFKMSKLVEPRLTDASGNIIEARRVRRPAYPQPSQANKPDPVRQDVPVPVQQNVQQKLPTGTQAVGPLGPIDSSNLAMPSSPRPQATGKPFDEAAQKKEAIARLARETEKRFPRNTWDATGAQLAAVNAAMAKAQGYKPKFKPLEAASMEFYPTRPILTSTRLPSERFERQRALDEQTAKIRRGESLNVYKPPEGVEAPSVAMGPALPKNLEESPDIRYLPNLPIPGRSPVGNIEFFDYGKARERSEKALSSVGTALEAARRLASGGKFPESDIREVPGQFVKGLTFDQLGAREDPSTAAGAFAASAGSQVPFMAATLGAGEVLKGAEGLSLLTREIVKGVAAGGGTEIARLAASGELGSEKIEDSLTKVLSRSLESGVAFGAQEVVGPAKSIRELFVKVPGRIIAGIIPPAAMRVREMTSQGVPLAQAISETLQDPEILAQGGLGVLGSYKGPDPVAPKPKTLRLPERLDLPEGVPQPPLEIEPMLGNEPFRRQPPDVVREAARIKQRSDENMAELERLAEESRRQALIAEARQGRQEELAPYLEDPSLYDPVTGNRRQPFVSAAEKPTEELIAPPVAATREIEPPPGAQGIIDEAGRTEELVSPDRPGPGQGPTQKLIPPRYSLTDAMADIDNMVKGDQGMSRREGLIAEEQAGKDLDEKGLRLEAYERGEQVDVSDITEDDAAEIARRRRLREGGSAFMLEPVRELTGTGVAKMIRDADQEGAIDSYLKEMGAEYYRPLGAGSFNAVIEIGAGKIARIGLGSILKPPTAELVNQPIALKEFPLPEPYYDPILGETATGIRVEIFPKLEMGDVSREEIFRLAEALEGDEVWFWDRAKANVGRGAQGSFKIGESEFTTRGRPMVLDPGAVARSGRGRTENETAPPRDVFALEARGTRPLQEELLPPPEPVERGVEGPRVEELRPPGEVGDPGRFFDFENSQFQDPADLNYEEFKAAVKYAGDMIRELTNRRFAVLAEIRSNRTSSGETRDIELTNRLQAEHNDIQDRIQQLDVIYRKLTGLSGVDARPPIDFQNFDSEGQARYREDNLEEIWNKHRESVDKEAFEKLRAYQAKIALQGNRALSKEEASLLGKNYKYEPMDVDEPTVGKEFYHGGPEVVGDASRLNPKKFGSSNSLYAIGLYLSDNPKLGETYAPEAEQSRGWELVNPETGEGRGYYENEGEALEDARFISKDRYSVEDVVTGEVLFESNDRAEVEAEAAQLTREGVELSIEEYPAVVGAERFTARPIPGNPEGRVYPVRLRNLKLIDLEKPLPKDAEDAFFQFADDLRIKNPIKKDREWFDQERVPEGLAGKDIVESLMDSLSGREAGVGTLTGRRASDHIPRILQKLGYDGFRHEGGQRVGGYGQHNVVILFPDFKGPGELYPQKFRLPGETGQLRIEELSSPDLGRTVETPSTLDMRSGRTEELTPPPSREPAPDLGRTVETPESGAMPRPGELVPLMQREGAWAKPERYQGEELAPPVLDAGKIRARTGVKLEDLEKVASEPYIAPVIRDEGGKNVQRTEEWPGYYNPDRASDFAALTQQEFLALADKNRPEGGKFKFADEPKLMDATAPERSLERKDDAAQHAFWVADAYFKWRNGEGPAVPKEVLDTPLEIPVAVDLGQKKGEPDVTVNTIREYVDAAERYVEEQIGKVPEPARSSAELRQTIGNLKLLSRMFGTVKMKEPPQPKPASKVEELVPSETLQRLSDEEAAADAKELGITVEEYRKFELEQMKPSGTGTAEQTAAELARKEAEKLGVPLERYRTMTSAEIRAAELFQKTRSIERMSDDELMEAVSKIGTADYDELPQGTKDAVRNADEEYAESQEIAEDIRIERTASGDEAESLAALGELAADGNPAAKAALEALQSEDVPKAPEIHLGQQVFAVGERGEVVALGKAVNFDPQGENIIVKKADGTMLTFPADRVRPIAAGQAVNVGDSGVLYGSMVPVTPEQIGRWIEQGVDAVKAAIDSVNTVRIGLSGRRTEQLIKLMPTLFGREAADQAFRAFQRIKSDLPAAFNKVDEDYVGLRRSLKKNYGSAKAKEISEAFWHGMQSFNSFWSAPDGSRTIEWNETGIAYDVVGVKRKPRELEKDAIIRTINEKKIKLPDGTIGTDADFNPISLGDGRYRLFKKFKGTEREDALAVMLSGDKNAKWADLKRPANPNGTIAIDPKLLELAERFNDLRGKYSTEHGFVDANGKPQIEGYIHHFAARNFFGAFGKMFQAAKAAPTKMRTGRSFQQKTVEMDGFESMRRMEKEFVKAKIVGEYKAELVALLGATAEEIGPEQVKLTELDAGQFVPIKKEWTEAGKVLNRLASRPEGLMREIGIDPVRAKRLGFAMQKSGIFMPRVAAEMLGEMIDPKGSKIISSAAAKMPGFARQLQYGYALARDTMDWYMLSLLTQGKTAMRDLVTTGAFMFPMKTAGDFLKGTKRTVWNRDPNAFVPFKQDWFAAGRAIGRDLGGAYSPLSRLGSDVPAYLTETELPGSLYRDPLRDDSTLPALFEAPITKIMKLKNLADAAGKRLIYDAAYMAEAELQAREQGIQIGSQDYKDLLDRMRKNPQEFPEIRAAAKAKADAFAFGGEDLNPTIDRFTSGILGKLTLGLFSKFTAKTFQVLFDHSPVPLSQKTVRQLMLPTEARKIQIEGRPMAEIQRAAGAKANEAFKAQLGQIKSDSYKDAFAQLGKRTPANEAQWSKAYRDAYDRRKAAVKDPVYQAELDRLVTRRQNDLAARNSREKEDAIIRTALGWVGLAGTAALSKYAGLTAVPSEDESGKAYPEKFNEAFTVRTPFGKFNVKGITPLPEAIGIFDMTAKPIMQWTASKLRDPSINMPRLADAIDLPGRPLSPLEWFPQTFSGGPATQLLAGIFDQERRGPNSKIETKLEKAGRAVGEIFSAPLKGITQPVREAIDPYQRETEGTGFFDTFGKTIAAGTPGASLMLDKRTDPQTGEELRVGETSGIQKGIEELLPSPLARVAAPVARSFAPTDIKRIPEQQKTLYGSPSGRVQEPGKSDIEAAEEYLGRKLPEAEREEYKEALEEAFVPEQKKRYRAQQFIIGNEDDPDPRIFNEYERDALGDLRGAYERAEDEKSRDAILGRAGEMMSRRAETVATKSEEMYPGIDIPFDPKDPAAVAHNARVKAGAIIVLEKMKKNQYWSKLQNIEKRNALRAAAGEIANMFGFEKGMDADATAQVISDMSEFLSSSDLEDMLEEIIISTAERNRGQQ